MNKDDTLDKTINQFVDELMNNDTDDSSPEPKTFSPGRGRIILIILIAATIAACYFAYANRSYSSYSIQQRIDRSSVDTTNYMSYDDNLFSYSRDGASLADFEGNPIWNESFDMENPVCDINGDYILVYDREHTGAVILDDSGRVGSLSMTLPIVRASVAGNGDTAVLMQEQDTAYIRLFHPDGDIIASGEIHATNSGYPVAMDLSSDARRLLVSLLDLNDGDIKTTLCFYDFVDKDNVDKNHIMANFSYSDEVIPQVAFLGENAAVAVADEELIFFDFHKDITVRNRVFLSQEIENVFYSNNRAAIITSQQTDKGKSWDVLHVYSESGAERFIKHIPASMSYAGFMDNGEIVLHNGRKIRIFRDDGKEKLKAKSEESIRAIFPWDGLRNYYFITKDETQRVILQ